MEATDKRPKKHNPRASANPISVLFFWWTRRLFWRGRKGLTLDDVYEPLPEDQARPLADRLEREWRREEVSRAAGVREPSLLSALRRAFWAQYAMYGIVLLFHSCVVRVAYPLCLGGMVSYFSAASAAQAAAEGGVATGSVPGVGPEGATHEQALYFAGGLVAATALNVFLSHHFNLATLVLGMRVRVALTSLVYRKVLRLNCAAGARGAAAGQLVNLLSNDVARFDQLFMYLHHVWVMPLQAFIVLYFMWHAMGLAAFIGVASLFLQTVPVQSYLSKLTSALRMRVAQRTDERVRLMAEIVSGVQVIKMYAWEKPFQALVEAARLREVRVLLYASYLRGVYLAFMVFSERSSLFFTLLAYVLLGNPITADRVFMLAQFFNILQLSMAIFYPNAVQMAAEAHVSVKRLQSFMLLDELRAVGGAGGAGDASANGPKAKRLEADGADDVPLLALGDELLAEGGEGGVEVAGLRARWTPNAITDTLSNVTLHVPPGKLCAVIGPVGAGKTSLLLALLGELRASGGACRTRGRVSYATQEPWLFSGTLRANVVFGRLFDARRYRDVVRACALARDVQLLPRGDKTPVGERGGALSGGQRARVSLARAVYRDADVYLLDDPLSAVDAHVGKHLLDECICGLLADKTRILVTHQLQHLKHVDHIVIINNGRVEAQGSFDDLSRSRINFAALLARSESDASLNGANGANGADADTDVSNAVKRKARARRQSSSASEGGEGERAGGPRASSAARGEDEEEEAEDEAAEMLAQGPLQRRLYGVYASAGSGASAMAGVVLLLLLGQLAASGCDFFVTYWTNSEDTWRASQAAAAEAALAAAGNVSLLGAAAGNVSALGAAGVLLANTSDATWPPPTLPPARSAMLDGATDAPGTEAGVTDEMQGTTEGIPAEDGVTDNLLEANDEDSGNKTFPDVQRAEIPWLPPGTLVPEDARRWDTRDALLTYGGLVVACMLLTTARALAFFAAAMRSARALHDGAFAALLRAPMRFFDTNPAGRILNRFSKDMGSIDEMLPKYLLEAIQVFLVMASILVMVVLVNAWFLLVVVFLGVVFVSLRNVYLRSAQDLKRLEGITKSPVYSHLSATISGLVTIRAAKAQQRLKEQFDELQDENTACWYLTLATSSAFGFCLDIFSLLFVTAVTFSFLIADDGTQGGWVGLAISQALILTGMVQHGVRQSADASAQMTAVERVAQYSRLPPEPPLETEPAHMPVAGWPRRGEVSFDHVSMRYSQGEPPVLRDLCFVVEAGHKVGVVGRTGAGKSSLIAALFRLAPLEGSVRVDAAHTQRLGLHDLRRALAIIPQEPVLFANTLRFNLSPFADFTDDELWAALDEVELKDAVEALDAPVADGGANFSVGQRQLVCLARAILRNNRILILDEATANVDPQTDALIQATIRRKFGDRTVITIAHRLNTIMDSDNVLVMDAGQAVEYDHPHILLQNQKGHFYALVQETGHATAQELKAIAEKAYNRQQETEGSSDKKQKKTD